MTRPHGSYVKYVIEKCRCDECRTANKLYERERKARRVPPYVGASEVRRHLAELSEAGVGLKTVAKRSGVSHGALSKIVYGSTQRGPSKRVRRETAEKILAVTARDAANRSRIDATRTWEHVETLLARGWTRAQIGQALCGPQAKTLQLGRETVTAAHARTIEALLDEPVPERRDRWGNLKAPVWDPEAELRDEATRAQQAERQRTYRAQRAEVRDDEDQVVDYELPVLTIERGAWRAQAACRHDDVPTWLFFPARGDMETLARAREVCARCPVHEQCREAGQGELGVWGGTTEKARRSRSAA